MIKILSGQAFGRTMRDPLVKKNFESSLDLPSIYFGSLLVLRTTARRRHLGSRDQLPPGVISWCLDLALPCLQNCEQ